MLLATKDLIKIFGTYDTNASVFSLWPEMEVGHKGWKCDLFATCLHLNWFFWERKERCCTANHYTEQLTSITAGWWHWLHQTKGKIGSLSWVLSCQECLACETGQELEDSHWRIFKGLRAMSAFKLSLRYLDPEIDVSHFHKASARSKLWLPFRLCTCVSELYYFPGYWTAYWWFIL